MPAAYHRIDSFANEPTGAWHTPPTAHPGAPYANFHEFQKSLNVRSVARHIAHSFQVLSHSCIPFLDFFPRIHSTRF